MIDNWVTSFMYIYPAAVGLVGGALVKQSEAERDLSVTQRLGLAAGSTIQGAADFAGGISPLVDTLDVAGKAICLSTLQNYFLFIIKVMFGLHSL